MKAFLAAAAHVGATGIVSLANEAEIATKPPDYDQVRRSSVLTLPVQNHPIPDHGLPEDREAFAELTPRLCADLDQGKRLTLHCAVGIGRTGLVAQQILMAFGTEPSLAHKQVKSAGYRSWHSGSRKRESSAKRRSCLSAGPGRWRGGLFRGCPSTWQADRAGLGRGASAGADRHADDGATLGPWRARRLLPSQHCICCTFRKR